MHLNVRSTSPPTCCIDTPAAAGVAEGGARRTVRVLDEAMYRVKRSGGRAILIADVAGAGS